MKKILRLLTVKLFILIIFVLFFPRFTLQAQEDSIIIVQENSYFLITKNSNSGVKNNNYDSTQKYPNPFSPATKFPFNLIKDTPLIFTVSDSIKTTVIDKSWDLLREGSYCINFDILPGSLAIGLYYVSIIKDYETITKRYFVSKK